ncbi:MAG TPA: ABC transporter permease [Puia sp.]|nr:ABC transporter permease [Puia sp.]
MIRNYLKIAWRHMTRHRGYAIINVLGLTLGITCCLFIFLWVRDEQQMDNFGKKDIYVAYTTITADGQTTGMYMPQYHIVDTNHMRFYIEDAPRTVPEIKYLANFLVGYELPWGYPESLQAGDKILKKNGARVGEDFFKIFPFPLVEGDRATALKDMYGIVLTRKTATALFGSPHAAMGRQVRFMNTRQFVVTAVCEDMPANSTMQFDFLNNWEAQRKLLEYSGNEVRTYVELKPGSDPDKVAAELTQYLHTVVVPQKGVSYRLGLQRVSDEYLYSVFDNGRPATGRIEYVRIFSGVALFILLIACINFMNLSTARSVKRAREVGLRKVIGSSRGQLIGQFMGESLLFSFFALALSIGLLVVLLPAFNRFTGKQIQLPVEQPFFWGGLVLVALVTGIVAGSYPALYLSSLQPVRTLKGLLRFTRGSILFRKGLTVFQFVLSVFLLIATIVISRQTYYIQHANLGYDRENLVAVRIEGKLQEMKNYELFKQRLSVMPGIALVDRCTEAPYAMKFDVNNNDISWEGKPLNANVYVEPASVGFDFVRIMGLSIVQGRDFSRLNPTDSSDAFLVNEEAAREMGFKDPIGKWVQAWKKRGHIIGVIKDYHSRSLRDAIRPLLLDVKEYEYFGLILIKTKPGETREALASAATVYRSIEPDLAFAWQFVDEEYQKMYNSEMTTAGLSVLFAALAIGISCLGLLGLVLFAAEQRTKEIGIRKVLGASLGQILALFSADFLKLVLLAFLIAGPLGWLAMRSWLGNFAYRVELSWWIFALAGAGIALIALATLSYQAVRSAMANPVASLRSD